MNKLNFILVMLFCKNLNTCIIFQTKMQEIPTPLSLVKALPSLFTLPPPKF
jgi:hypothetical protein